MPASVHQQEFSQAPNEGEYIYFGTRSFSGRASIYRQMTARVLQATLPHKKINTSYESNERFAPGFYSVLKFMRSRQPHLAA
jgi:hypothetical protein